MAKRWKLLCLILALVMVLGAFAGCKKKEEDNPTTDDPIEEPPAPVETVEEIDLSEYTIVRPFSSVKKQMSSILVSAVADFKTAVDTLTGSDVKLEDDQVNAADSAKKEILIGYTNRPESQTAMEGLEEGKHQFSIRRIDNKLVIVGHTQELVTRGLAYLTENYVSKSTGEGKFEFAKDETVTKSYKFHEIITDEMPKYEVIYSMSANDSVKNASEGVWKYLNSLTTQDAVLGTDFFNFANGIEELFSRSGIVVGTTQHPRTQELLAEADYFSWTMETDSDQIYLFGSDNDSIEAVCAYMQNLIAAGKVETAAKTTVRITKGDPVVGTGAEWSSQIPRYNGGTLHSIEEFSENYFRLYYTGTTRAAYNEYQAKVLAAGYKLYSANELEGNVYKTYKNGTLMLHSYYLENEKTVSIAVTPLKNFTDYPLAPVSDSKVTDPAMSVIAMDYMKISGTDGAGFIFTMPDGSYVVIDGGHGRKGSWKVKEPQEQQVDDKGNPVFAEDGNPVYVEEFVITYEGVSSKLYNYMKENNQRTDGKILIRAWIITNAKSDHYGAFVDFAADHAAEVTLEYFVAQFDYDKQTMSADGSGNNKGNGKEVQAIMDAKRMFQGTKYIVPMMGQKMYFGTMETTFLYTAEAFCHADPDNVGDHSLVFRSVFEGNSFLFTSDIGLDVLKIVTKNYTEATLKSTFVQVPSHGTVGRRDFWNAAQPTYLIICTSEKDAYMATTTDKAFIKYATELVDGQDNPLIKAVFDGESRYEVETAKFPYVYVEEPEGTVDGDFTTNQDTMTWGDLFANGTSGPSPDHRPGDYDTEKDSTTWEDMITPATA